MGSRLRRVQDADLKDKVVLVRVDHNCVKDGVIHDTFRVDQSIATLYNIVERGGRPILMTHVNRPYDKKSRQLTCRDEDAVTAVVRYLQHKLGVVFAAPTFRVEPGRGILDVDTSVNWLIEDLKHRRVGGVYLPNTRWFEGEEGLAASDADAARNRFTTQLAGLADVFVNDAFGSWQPHVSTYHVAKMLPSCAGLLMQKEVDALSALTTPVRPFLAVIAGSKLDTKMGCIKAIAEKADHVMLGGQLYNAYIAAKFGVKIKGVDESDVAIARTQLLVPEVERKLVPLGVVIESDALDGCGCVPVAGKCGVIGDGMMVRARRLADLKPGETTGYFLDVSAESFRDARVTEVIANAKTIFVNAVMGLTSAGFHEGTAALDAAIASNVEARKYFGGGDTLQEFKSLSPGLYMTALECPSYYLFTGGGTVLKALELGDATKLPCVEMLLAAEGETRSKAPAPKCMALESCDCGPPPA